MRDRLEALVLALIAKDTNGQAKVSQLALAAQPLVIENVNAAKKLVLGVLWVRARWQQHGKVKSEGLLAMCAGNLTGKPQDVEAPITHIR